VKPEIGSFPKSVTKHFYDEPLPQYLDPKTVIIYCPHPVSGVSRTKKLTATKSGIPVVVL
jgi:hypothetical protein